EVHALAAELQRVAGPELRLLLRRITRRRAQGGLVLHDDGDHVGCVGRGRCGGHRGSGRRCRRAAQREAGQRDRQGDEDQRSARHHSPSFPPACAVCACAVAAVLDALSSVEPMKPPSAGGGAMITWILSDSLSASVFWISSGCVEISTPSRSIWSLAILPTRSSR